jgi:hypothetical protein
MRTLVVVAAMLLAVLAWLLFRTQEHYPPLSPRATPVDAAPGTARVESVASEALATPESSAAEVRATVDVRALSTVTTPPRCRVFGRVLDEQSGPLAGVELSLYAVGGPWSKTDKLEPDKPADRSYERLRITTGLDGRFEFDAPVPTADWVSLTISPSPYFALVDRHFGPAGGRDKPRLVEGDNDLCDIVLAVRGAVEGRIVSESGAPIAGANAAIAADGDRISNASSDESGHFVVGHLPAGPFELGIRAEGWLQPTKVTGVVELGATARIDDVVLTPAPSISGIVVEESGAPVAGVRVRGTPTSRGQSTTAKTGTDGTFTLYISVNHACSLSVETRGAEEFEAPGRPEGTLEPTYEPGTTNVRIVLKRAPRITFHVIDAATRAPIARFGLRTQRKLPPGSYSSATSAEIELADHPDGRLTLPAPGSTSVTVWAEGYAPLDADVATDPGASDVQTLALSPAAAIQGRVVHNGGPIAKVSVLVQGDTLGDDGLPAAQPGSWGTNLHTDVSQFAARKRSVVTGADGMFRFGNLATGTFALQFDGPDVARRMMRGVKATAGVVDLGDVELTNESVVRGSLLTAEGDSAVGFKVLVNKDDVRGVTIESADGRFEIKGLQAGPHTIRWLRPDENGWSDPDPRVQQFTLAPGETREIVLDARASEPCTVVVRVTRAGEPVAGIAVHASIQRGPDPRQRIDQLLGVTGTDGAAVGTVPGDMRFDLVARMSDHRAVGFNAQTLTAAPGDRMETAIEIVTGTLVVELPAAFARPESGRVGVSLRGPVFTWLYETADTPGSKALGMRPSSIAWDTNVLAFGEFPAAEYEAEISFVRFEPDPAAPKGSNTTTVPLRDPFKTTVRIEKDREARIVVP